MTLRNNILLILLEPDKVNSLLLFFLNFCHSRSKGENIISKVILYQDGRLEGIVDIVDVSDHIDIETSI